MLRNFKQTREKIFHGVYPEHKKEMLRLRSAWQRRRVLHDSLSFLHFVQGGVRA